MNIKNLKFTDYYDEKFRKKVKKGFHLLTTGVTILGIAVSFVGCKSKSKEKEIEHETIEIVQYNEPETDFIDLEDKVDPIINPDYFGNTDVEMVIGDIYIGPSKVPNVDKDDKQEAEIHLSFTPKKNCADFICIVNSNANDSENIYPNFEKFIKGEQTDIVFTNVTNKSFIWKTDRIEEPYCCTYGCNDPLPEEIDTKNYRNYIKELNIYDHYDFQTMRFDAFATRSTKSYLCRYNYENCTFAKYDLETFIRLDSTDWKGKGFWSYFSNTSQGYENKEIDRKDITKVTLHGEKCATHEYQIEEVKVLRKDLV